MYWYFTRLGRLACGFDVGFGMRVVVVVLMKCLLIVLFYFISFCVCISLCSGLVVCLLVAVISFRLVAGLLMLLVVLGF